MLIKNGEVYTKAFLFVKEDIRVEDGRIVELAPDLAPKKGEEVLDATGKKIIPGLTDIHSHGCKKYDYCDADDKGLATMLAYEKSVGVTQMCPTTMTYPEDKVEEICKVIASHEQKTDEAEIVGINLEGPYISPQKVGAQNPAYVKPADAKYLRNLLEETGHLPKLITIAPEEEGNLEVIKEMKDEIRFSVGHTMATYDEAKEAFAAGAKHMTHLYNAMPGITHRAPGPIVAAAETEGITAELICDGIHSHPAAVRFAFATFGADRIILISDSTRATGMPDGEYELGGQPIFKAEGIARLADGTISGSVTNLFDCMGRAIQYGVSPEDAVRAATYNPCKAIGILKDYGTIEVGKKANLDIVNADFTLAQVIM